MREEPDLVFFDMDHTLLALDADNSWKYFLVDEGLAPAEDRARADRYLHLYHLGQCPVDEFLRFQLREFSGRTPTEMNVLAQRHFSERIQHFIYPEAVQVIQDYTVKGIPTLLLTGTNRVIAEPIVTSLGTSSLLATDPEILNGRFTGGITGPFLSKKYKLQKAKESCDNLNSSMQKAAFYADSINDLELLEQVGFPMVVNPSEKLRIVAEERQWQIKSWSRSVYP